MYSFECNQNLITNQILLLYAIYQNLYSLLSINNFSKSLTCERRALLMIGQTVTEVDTYDSHLSTDYYYLSTSLKQKLILIQWRKIVWLLRQIHVEDIRQVAEVSIHNEERPVWFGLRNPACHQPRLMLTATPTHTYDDTVIQYSDTVFLFSIRFTYCFEDATGFFHEMRQFFCFTIRYESWFCQAKFKSIWYKSHYHNTLYCIATVCQIYRVRLIKYLRIQYNLPNISE